MSDYIQLGLFNTAVMEYPLTRRPKLHHLISLHRVARLFGVSVTVSKSSVVFEGDYNKLATLHSKLAKDLTPDLRYIDRE